MSVPHLSSPQNRITRITTPHDEKWSQLISAALIALALLMQACATSAPQLTPWPRYPLLQQPRIYPHMLVLKCTYADERSVRPLPPNLSPAIPSLDQYIASFMGSYGNGGLLDFFGDVSYGAIEMDTKILGWYDAPFTKAAGAFLSREQRVQQCANAIPADEAQTITFSDYAAIIIVMNDLTDGGACGPGKVPLTIQGKPYSLGCAAFDWGSLYGAFATQEVAHTLGLQHSYAFPTTNCQFPTGVYCDPFDEMSDFTPFQFFNPNYPPEVAENTGGAGPGFNVPNLLFLKAMPKNYISTYQVGSTTQSFNVSALSQPNAWAPLVIEIIGNDPTDFYTVEYRQTSGWDQGLPVNLVLIHEYKNNQIPYSFLQVGPRSGGWAVGDTWTNSTLGVSVAVTHINPSIGTADVTVSSIH